MRSIVHVFSRVAAIALLAGLWAPAFGQSLNPTQYTDVQLQMYDAFFFRVTWLEEQANKLAAQGKDPGFARSIIQKEAGLTAQEATALKAIAADWKAQKAPIAAAANAMMAAGASAGTSAPLLALRNQRDQMVAAHIDQTRAAFGTSRFPALDSYVKTAPAVSGGPAGSSIKAPSSAMPAARPTGRRIGN